MPRMGLLREYIREYWRDGMASYSQGKSIAGAVGALVAALALIGAPNLVPAVPWWFGYAWLAVYVAFSVLLVWPYRMWKAQRQTINDLQGPFTADWRIRDLFHYIRPDLIDRGTSENWKEVARDVMDKLSTMTLTAWGRPAEGGHRPLELIPVTYWRDAEFTFHFLLEDGNDLERHVRHLLEQDYRDLRVSRAQAMRIWPRK